MSIGSQMYRLSQSELESHCPVSMVLRGSGESYLIAEVEIRRRLLSLDLQGESRLRVVRARVQGGDGEWLRPWPGKGVRAESNDVCECQRGLPLEGDVLFGR